MNRKTFFLIAFAAIAAYLLLLFFVTQVLFKSPKPTPTPTNFYGGESGNLEPKKGGDIVSLIEKLPHSGEHFSISYDNSKTSFFLNIDPNNKDAGEAEFEAYLKANGFNNASELLKVTTTYNPM